MKKISNKEFLQPLKNRPGLEPRLEFKNQLLQELQTVRPQKLKFKSVQMPLLYGIAAVLVLVMISGGLNLLRQSGSSSSELMKSTARQPGFAGNSNSSMDNAQKASPVATFYSEKYHVSLSYPIEWKPVTGTEDQYEGESGFFRLSSLDGGKTLAELANSEAGQKSQPFGSQPEFIQLKIDGNNATLIMPSDDQGKQYKQQAEVIVQYSKKLSVDEVIGTTLSLIADKEHIKEIAVSMKFN
jgi:hypothetical protein